MWFAGIDWSDQALDFHLRTADGQVLAEGTVRPNLEGLATLYGKLDAHAPPDRIGIAIETSHGAWMQALLDHGYRIYPVNPKSVESFREALSANGNKSDAIDRKVLAMFLVTFHQDLRPLKPDDPEIITLRIACEDRVRLIQERTAKLSELGALLKIYYPAFLGFFGDFESQIALKFLQQFPTQTQMQGLTPVRLRGWLKRHAYPCSNRIETMTLLLQQPALPVPQHLQKAKATMIRYLATSLIALKAEIAQRESDIDDRFGQMPEADWIRTLPGTGPTLGPALLACLGRDRQRFATTQDARAFMGTAPVTLASGGSRVVRFRRGCWKFARRTLQLFADASRHQCTWAQELYDRQRAKGRSHHRALRTLAHKWLKIILAMWRTETPYNEATFRESRQRYLLKKTALQT
jgi:transposase